MPFSDAWTDLAPPELERSVLQWGRRCRAGWRRDDGQLNAVVSCEGVIVGVQDRFAEDFGALQTATTGSWLGRAHPRRGIGREMRAAMLHLAFAGLGSLEARSGAWADHAASLAVSRRLGDESNGSVSALRRGARAEMLEPRLTRATWSASARPAVELTGLEGCLEWSS